MRASRHNDRVDQSVNVKRTSDEGWPRFSRCSEVSETVVTLQAIVLSETAIVRVCLLTL